jgi:transcription initiation factor TFIIB
MSGKATVTGSVKDMALRLELPKQVEEDALQICRQARELNLLQGRVTQSMAAAAVFVACRAASLPFSISDITLLTRGTTKEVARHARLLVADLHLVLPSQDPSTYIPRYCAALGLPLLAQQRALAIVGEAREAGALVGNALGYAAAAIYIACKQTRHHLTQQQIARMARVSEVTLRNRYKQLLRELNIPLS